MGLSATWALDPVTAAGCCAGSRGHPARTSDILESGVTTFVDGLAEL
jgi:hypothetical protein